MKMHRLSAACLAVLVGALVGDLFAQPHRDDVQGILNQSGVSCGLCLVVGAKSPAIAEAESIAANALRLPHFPRFAIAFSGLLDCSSQAANPPASRYFHS